MNTTSTDKLDLLYTKNFSVEILDFDTGLKRRVTISSQNREYVRFFISPTIYGLADEWKILQNDTFETVKNLIKNEKGMILDKFGRTKEYLVIGRGTSSIGWPDLNIWYDGHLVIKKDN